jgi:hypothetical protein
MISVPFYPRDKDAELLVPHPKPAREYYPDWMKQMPTEWQTPRGSIQKTATACVPFTDTFANGYIQELAQDVRVTPVKTANGVEHIDYAFGGLIKQISTRGEKEGMPNVLPPFKGYYNAEISWETMWEPKTPKGYSAFYHHPNNRFDLPFHTMSGIIDTDKWSTTGPIPFLLKEGFEGVIPAGTPIYQITFIKREHWKATPVDYDENFLKIQQQTYRKFLSNGFRKSFWEKKTYE